MIGKTLGHYEITGELGKGGMGEVYRARDTKLNRDVALKVLPAEFANDPERMARFKREAQTLASLNHTSIAAIYGLEESGDVRALIMELAEGPTLADRISKGPIPLDDALAIARQIAEALEAAHEKGIIHRDLKPANIKVTPDGAVKVLDFGLAKALEGEAAVANASESPTLSIAATKAGVILGTAAYMSPEQARGSAVDKRCDVWSFGVVLFEMLTGKQLFAGETVSDTLAAVLRSDINWNLLPKNTPASIRMLLPRCLDKDRRERLRDIGEARIAISRHLANPSGNAASEKISISARKKIRIAWGAAAVLFLAALALGIFTFLHLPKAPLEAPITRLEVNAPPTWDSTSLAISPDGRYLAFVASTEAGQGLWLRPLDQIVSHLLPGTEDGRYPFWSPDSRSIGFFAGGKLKTIDIDGGPPQVVANAPNGAGGTWNTNGVIVYAPAWASSLYCVQAAGGGKPVPITQLESPRQAAHLFPKFLPDGRRLLFYSWGTDAGIYLGTLDSTETRRLRDADSAAVYAPPGYLLFMRRSTLLAQQFDAESANMVGDPVKVVDSVDFFDLHLLGGFSTSETGVLAYRTAASTLRRLAWFDRTGKEIGNLGAPDENNLSDPELSPDGRFVAVDRGIQGRDVIVQGNLEVYLIDAMRGEPNRFTFDAAQDRFPIWSPDGKSITFASNRNGTIINFFQKAVSGAADDQLLYESPHSKRPNSWSPDGRFLLFTQFGKAGPDLWMLDLAGDSGKALPFEISDFSESNGQFAPDGRWVAYMSDSSGRHEIYVRAFPGPGDKQQISIGGGFSPRWRPDGKELFYITPDGRMMAAPIQATGSSLQKGAPAALFQIRKVGMLQSFAKPQYAVASDGQRFLINTIVDESTASPIVIVTNWARALTK